MVTTPESTFEEVWEWNLEMEMEMETRNWKYGKGNGNQDDEMKSWEWKRKCIPPKHSHRITLHNLEMFSQQPESAKP